MERLRRLFAQDLGLKGFSLLAGIAIWYGVHRYTLDEIVLPDVPVDVGIPAGRPWTARVAPAAVRLKVSGPKHLIEKLQDRPVSVRIQMSGGETPDGSERRIPIEAAHLAPRLRGIALESRPAEVTVILDEIVEETFRVEPDVAASPPGFKVGGLLATPGSVTVRGPRALLSAARGKAASLKTARIDPGYQAGGSFPFNNVEVIPRLLDVPVQCEPATVTVLVTVTQEQEYRRIDKIPLRRLVGPQDPAARQVELPREISLNVKGPKTVLLPDGARKPFHDLLPQDIVAYVALPADLQPGIHPEVPVRIQLPEGVVLDQPAPTVRVEVK